MTRTMPLVEARKRLTSLPEELEHEGEIDVLAVTRRGKPVLAVMPWDLYEAVTETLEIMGDKEMMAALRRGIKDVKEGRTYSTEELKMELGL